MHTVELKNQHRKVFYDKLKLIYIELPKFTKTLEQLDSHQDKWLYLLRHLPDLEDQPEPFKNPVILQLIEIAEIANFSTVEQDGYQSSLKYYRDLNNVISTSRQEGREEGRKESEKRAIAQSLLGQLPIDAIAQATGLSREEVEQIRDQRGASTRLTLSFQRSDTLYR